MKCLICKKKLGRRTIEVTVKSFNTKRKIYNTILHPICFDCIENLNFRKYKQVARGYQKIKGEE